MNETNREFLKSKKIPNLKYPHLLDPSFQKKISLKKEFQSPYVSKTSKIQNNNAKGLLCSDTNEFELAPHQEFSKAFLSKHTPYNGLLLYHGMGSGKTCSAIGIAEEFRQYHKYDMEQKKIFIIASPNVQKNFRRQLFNEDDLFQKKGKWKIKKSCVGNKILQELELTTLKTKEEVIKKMKSFIRKYYTFFGYDKFANVIQNLMKDEVASTNQIMTKKIKMKLRQLFSENMIIIDEVHNIRDIGATQQGKKVSEAIRTLVQYVKYMKLLFLSGTPMYNDPKEIVFLLNILHKNDGLSPISISQIFHKNGDLTEKGGELLLNAANGYISYVRGEDPYHFPFKIYPFEFEKEKSILNYMDEKGYPRVQFNEKPIETPIQFLDIYTTTLSEYQKEGYIHILQDMISKGFSRMAKNGTLQKYDFQDLEKMDSFSYTFLQVPLNALTLCIKDSNDRFVTGKDAMDVIGGINDKNYFIYNEGYENTFQMEKIQPYSSKIHAILQNIQNSDGIVLIYSQYLDSGLLPIAIALEEMGFSRVNSGAKNKNLLDNKKVKSLKYSMITGDKRYTQDNMEKELSIINKNTNKNGSLCKVVLISMAGSEGLDFKHLRQVHILEPWYNLNRIDQIIGRAIRYCSHKELPLEKRNSEIFLHGSVVQNNEQECIDMMIYRQSEKKAKKIGVIQKLLKSISVDCLINHSQKQYASLNQNIEIVLSNQKRIMYDIKDKENSSICDYGVCDYSCYNALNNEEYRENTSSYHYDHTFRENIISKVKQLFAKSHVYPLKDIVEHIETKKIKKIHIYRALEYLTNNMQETIIDKFSQKGYLTRIQDLYLFQREQSNTIMSSSEHMKPLTYKKQAVSYL
ncbi:MAG: hypothetical protein CMP11_00425, partial [Zetaproteobacteria bacterium]|nr:hypothetical protein [Pseudobdellovibrionaceae bacterium]